MTKRNLMIVLFVFTTAYFMAACVAPHPCDIDEAAPGGVVDLDLCICTPTLADGSDNDLYEEDNSECPEPGSMTCYYDNYYSPGSGMACRQFAEGADAAQAQTDCTTDMGLGSNLGGTAVFSADGACDASYTGSCTYPDGSVDYFEAGDCSTENFSNEWGCGMGGGAFECLL